MFYLTTMMNSSPFRRLLRPLFAGWLFCTSQGVQAKVGGGGAGRTFFIAPGGSDQHPGTSPDRPWSTLHHAATQVVAGDTVLVADGVYSQETPLVITACGTAEQPIVFKARGPMRPVLDFSAYQATNPGTRSTGLLFGPGASHIRFEGFEVAHAPGSGIRVQLGTHITLRDCVVHDVQRVAIAISGDHCLVENNEVYRACLVSVGCNEWPGEWPQAVNTGLKPPVPPATVGTMSYNNVFRGNYIHDSWGEGIDAIYSDGVIIENNVIHDVMSVGIYLDHSRNAVIRGNSLYTTNDVYGRGKERRPMTGILLGAEYLSLFIDHPPHSHIENVEIYNNVCVRVGKGIGHWLDHANPDNKNIYERVRIYHNTVDTKNGEGPAIWFPAELKFSTHGNECKNNIFCADRTLSAEPGFVFENNLWVNGVPETGRHVNSFNGDPGWIAPDATRDMAGYRLKSGSPALGRAQPIKGLLTDKTGRLRANPPDLGAWELADKPAGAAPVAAVSALQLLEPVAPPDFIPGVNTVRNPSFEDPAAHATPLPPGWQATGDPDALQIVSPGFRGVRPRPDQPPGQAVALGKTGPYTVTLMQTVTNLPDGRYGLQVRVRRFGSPGTFWAETETADGTVLRSDIPERAKLLHDLVDYEDPNRPEKHWLQLCHSDIRVTGGCCTIRFHGEGGAEDRLLVDDVCLFRY